MNRTDKEIRCYFKNIFGFHVRHLDPYRIALTHKSASVRDSVCGRLNNERLEYLGDAILGSVVADFLYHKYPLEAEGVLTRMRSKLVNRARLNMLSRKLGLHELLESQGCDNSLSADGNAFEAVVGAIYLDQGYRKTYKIIINNIICTHLDIDQIFGEDDDYKSRILIWAQHNHHKIQFESSTTDNDRNAPYKAVLKLDGQVCAEGLGRSVKMAEQAASEKALAQIM